MCTSRVFSSGEDELDGGGGGGGFHSTRFFDSEIGRLLRLVMAYVCPNSLRRRSGTKTETEIGFKLIRERFVARGLLLCVDLDYCDYSIFLLTVYLER